MKAAAYRREMQERAGSAKEKTIMFLNNRLDRMKDLSYRDEGFLLFTYPCSTVRQTLAQAAGTLLSLQLVAVDSLSIC
jgi:hypothetical protein